MRLPEGLTYTGSLESRTTTPPPPLPEITLRVDDDVPPVSGHRQVTDAHLVTLARRHGVGMVTFDAGLAALAGHRDVELLTAL